VSAVMTFVWI